MDRVVLSDHSFHHFGGALVHDVNFVVDHHHLLGVGIAQNLAQNVLGVGHFAGYNAYVAGFPVFAALVQDPVAQVVILFHNVRAAGKGLRILKDGLGQVP